MESSFFVLADVVCSLVSHFRGYIEPIEYLCSRRLSCMRWDFKRPPLDGLGNNRIVHVGSQIIGDILMLGN